jgi:hypothetical protein
MRVPTLRDPGFIALIDEHPNGKFVLWDGRLTGDERASGYKCRWVVEHWASGEKKMYSTKAAARIDAIRCAKSVHEHDQWWVQTDE